jgi:hypothetical protein
VFVLLLTYLETLSLGESGWQRPNISFSLDAVTQFINFLVAKQKLKDQLQSIPGDETVNVNKPSPVSPQLTARSGQSAQLVPPQLRAWSGQSAQFRLLTAFGRTLICIQTLDTPATVHPSRDRRMISF